MHVFILDLLLKSWLDGAWNTRLATKWYLGTRIITKTIHKALPEGGDAIWTINVRQGLIPRLIPDDVKHFTMRNPFY